MSKFPASDPYSAKPWMGKMESQRSFRFASKSFSAQLQIRTVGVIYCTSNSYIQGREFEKMADCEVIDVAHAVKGALESYDCHVDLIDLNPDQIADLRRYDWIFNLAETIYGYPLNDYEVAEKMEAQRISFTGSGSNTLQACLNKAITKAELIKYGVATPAYDMYPLYDDHPVRCDFPVIVKPLHEDGSIGISSDSIAWNPTELTERVERLHRTYHQAALVEEFIEGRDITASVLGNGEDAQVLPLSEVTYPKKDGPQFLTFSAKWVADSPEYQKSAARCPCELDSEVEQSIRQTALQACRIMNCRDYARVDFRLQGTKPYVLEVNPNPCINPDDSGFVRSGKASGYSYSSLIHRIMESSVKNNCVVGEPISIRSFVYENRNEGFESQ